MNQKQQQNWITYCKAAGIADPVSSIKGFDSVPRYIRIREFINVKSPSLKLNQETNSVTNNNTAHTCAFFWRTTVISQFDLNTVSVHRVPWLPHQLFVFSVHNIKKISTEENIDSDENYSTSLKDLQQQINEKVLKENGASAASSLKINYEIISMDASSLVPLLALCPKLNNVVLDICCAPGMKLITICDLLSSSSSGVAMGVDASLDRALVCRSLLSQHVSRKYCCQDEFGHCRLYLGDGCTFSPQTAEPQAAEGLRNESTNPAKTSRQQKYQLQKIQKLMMKPKSNNNTMKALPERRERRSSQEDENDEQEEDDDTQSKNTIPECCLWESEGCPKVWDQKNQKEDLSSPVFDRVIVDAECTHDGSVSHFSQFKQANFGDKSPSFYNNNTDISGHQQKHEQSQDDDENTEQHEDSSSRLQKMESKLNELYDLQLRLLLGGYRCCKKNGGVLVYSTCSMSPKQNEEIIKKFISAVGEGAVTLVDPFEEVLKIDSDKTSSYSQKLQYDDQKTSSNMLRKEVGTESSILPLCYNFHPSKAKTSVQFVAKFVKNF